MRLHHWRKVAFDPVAWQLSRRRIDSLLSHEDVDSAVRATERYVGRGFYDSIRSVQVDSEIRSLAELVQQARPEVIVEIGTYKGGTLFIWCRTNPQAKLIVSIDLPCGMYGGGYDPRRRKLYRRFVADRRETRMELMQCDSHAASTLARLREALGDSPIDFLYIDGDHTYEGVKQDFEMYSPLVRHGGIVAFHDTATLTRQCGVHRLWDELRSAFEHKDLTAPSSNKGIGVVFQR